MGCAGKHASVSFNGATAMKPWKRWRRRSACRTRPSLQWGHGDEAVEESEVQTDVKDSSELQWGHGDEAVEEDEAHHATAASYQLQWGHGDEAVEEARGWVILVCDRHRFNGATAMKPWKSRSARSSGLRRASFNGATAMKPWKRNGSAPIGQRWYALQWGHGDEAVEEPSGEVLITFSHRLQWGHGDEAVEESKTPLRLSGTTLASMGPRR